MAQERLTILVLMAHAGYARNLESVIDECARRGHRVHIGLDREPDVPSDVGILERLADGSALVTSEPTPLRRVVSKSPAAKRAVRIRRSLDLLHYSQPALAEASALRGRAESRAPQAARKLARMPKPVAASGRMMLRGALAGLPPDRRIVSFIQSARPDVVVVTPLVEFGSPQSEYVRAAQTLGIPVVYAVASWDNLTTKGRVHETPDTILVWNELQLDEARRIHGLDGPEIVVTGATAYDHWFHWQPSTTPEEFRAAAGLPSEGPIVTYLGSSGFIAPNEQRFVAKWLTQLRRQPVGARLNVVIRPHPTNPLRGDGHTELDRALAGDDAARIWPPDGENPTTEQSRQTYFDTLYHSAAVVGLNTSALLEASILRKPVLALLDEEYRGTQEGTVHFHYLRDALSGVASSFPEHVAQLEEQLDRGEAPAGGFVERFLRPGGIENDATPAAVDAIERTARAKRPVRREPALANRALARLVSPLVTEPSARPVERRAHSEGSKLRVLFALHYPGYLRYFSSTIAELARRGHTVDICFDVPSKQDEGLAALESMPAGVELLPTATPRRLAAEKRAIAGIRNTGNYLQYLHPRYRGAHYLRDRNTDRLPRRLEFLSRIDTLPAPLVRLALAAVKTLDRGIPVAPKAISFLRSRAPDVVLVSPLIVGSSPQVDLVAAARSLGIPTGYAVGSWDHLTTKGILHVEPDRIFVWNNDQVAEAREIHGVPATRVVVTGAQPFDKWFEREPSLDRERFCAQLGLDPERPIVLFVGSTASISSPDAERAFVARWRAALRDDPRTAGFAVVIRPHPYNSDQWRNVSYETADTVIWPADGSNPADPADQDVFFDSLFHAAAVVGVNTSAMIEAAIVDRPVLTILDSAFDATQGKTLHFQYFLPTHGGYVQTASSLDEHIEQLAEAVLSPDPRWSALRQAFVSRFVRPNGAGRPATQELANAIEELSRLEPRPPVRARVVGRALRSYLARQKEKEKATMTPSRRTNDRKTGGVDVRAE